MGEGEAVMGLVMVVWAVLLPVRREGRREEVREIQR